MGAEDRSNLKVLKKAAKSSSQKALGIAAKLARERTEAYKLTGRMHWLLGQQDQALKWWTKSIAEGERLGARPELARTYLEVAQRLAESGSKHRALNDTDAEAYLTKARTLFSDLGLEWDLEKVELIQRRAA